MAHHIFRVGSWLTLAAAILTAIMAAAAVTLGALALTGTMTYPMTFNVGPVHISNTVSMPVALNADVCQTADIDQQATASKCFRYFVHNENTTGLGDRIRHQDGDVRPTSATLTGTVEVATTGGWSPLVAVSVLQSTIGLAATSGVLFLFWRLLATVAAGKVFSPNTVRHVRGIGAIVLAAGLIGPAIGLFTSATQLGYSIEAFGYDPHLTPLGSEGVNLPQIALGALIILVAEVFRRGANLEAEQRMTI